MKHRKSTRLNRITLCCMLSFGLTAKAAGIYNLMAEIQFLEKSMFGNLSESVAANLRFAHAMRKMH